MDKDTVRELHKRKVLLMAQKPIEYKNTHWKVFVSLKDGKSS